MSTQQLNLLLKVYQSYRSYIIQSAGEMGPPGSDTVWFANTGLITKRQNRFCLYLDPPIGAFSPKCKIKCMDVRLIYMHTCF